MTCKQLGGACDKEFHANTFEEMAEMSKKHGTEMFQKGDEEHLKAMNEMMELMKNPDAMKEWFENKKKEFEALPEDNKLIVEIAQFKLASGVTDEEFIKEAEDVQKNFLEKQSGYVDRELLKAKDGQWIDILHWDSRQEAQKAAEMMIKEPTTQGFMKRIDSLSVKMLHLEQVITWNK